VVVPVSMSGSLTLMMKTNLGSLLQVGVIQDADGPF
jgi:hypothetical protein